MTAVIPSHEAGIVEDETELQAARNLQELLDSATLLFMRHQLDHAVLFRLSSDAGALVFPLVPTLPSVVEPLHSAIVQKAHPAFWGCGHGIAVRTFADLQAGSRSVLVQSLRQAFHAVRLDHVYELPLQADKEDRFILEVGRVGRPIARDELREMQRMAELIPQKLPWFMRRLPTKRAEPCLDYLVI